MGSLRDICTDVIGDLVGLKGITPPRNLELLPYILPGVSRVEEDNETDGVFDIGLDLKYGITSNLTADLTLNTDFAQVEAESGAGQPHPFQSVLSRETSRSF